MTRLWPRWVFYRFVIPPLLWRHNDRDDVSNRQPQDCLLNRLIRRKSKKTSKLRVTGICVGNSLGTGEIPAQRASNAENVSIWWRHHGLIFCGLHIIVHVRARTYCLFRDTWWRDQMERFSASLALCAGSSPVSSPHKGKWRGALMFSLISAWTNGRVNNRDAGDLRWFWCYASLT